MATPIEELRKQGQSLWLDNIRRQLITSGELAKLRDEGVSGVTSNPTIFEKAVSGSTDYDEALVHLVKAGRKPEDILWELMVEDIQAAADVYRPVYDETGGGDGYVSIEVSPVVAMDTDKTIAIAQDLHRRTNRPNVMVKIPATLPGLPAIRHMIGEGVNINVTLIFSTERYDAVVEAYQAGLEDLRKNGGDLSKVASVASFFVSRVDTKVDKILEARIEAAKDPKERQRLQSLLSKAAIANSKMAYQHWKDLFAGDRWETLKAAGARPQRCLWASTSTKDPRLPDTYYVEELIGPDTVDTVPPATLAAFREHGEARRSLDDNVDVARRQLQDLEELGIDMTQVTRQLEEEGVQSFAKSFESLIKTLKDAARDIETGHGPRMWFSLGTLQPKVDEAVTRLQKEDVPHRLWAKDPTLWTQDPTRKAEIMERLGWLYLPEQMLDKVDSLKEKATEAARAFDDVVVLGMGGSSLAPDVFRHTFGVVRGHPRLHVLDTTDPGSILTLRNRIDPRQTLFIVASKSGTTTETLSHFAYFWQEVRRAGSRRPGRNFAAITDPGTPLEKLAGEREFRWTILNPRDIGGRYSALSNFGLVPGAVQGIDVAEVLERAQEMAHSCDAPVPVEKNPGIWLGTVLGQLASIGQDKLTLILSPKVDSFGFWLEQLVAESTGKEGKGIVPIEGEPLGAPDEYGDDRLFVYTRMQNDPDNDGVQQLERAGRPVITLTMRDKLDLGSEILRWELATAVACSVLGVDPFDQPNVQESKDNVMRVLQQFESEGELAEAQPVPAAEAGPAIADLLRQAKPNGYFAVMAYTSRTAASEAALAQIRGRVRQATRLATTAGYGPRYLHSTGQLHKGGPATGLSLQVVQDDTKDVEIPGEPYTFSTLKRAQALGDLRALEAHGRPVLRVTLGRSLGSGWKALAAAVDQALK
ncbi:MAG: transaldolase [Candidatus Nephthysia bennettiae]|uniref:Transaldolase n=1 Tax=Candidatus Nephthysia bennettiae TaxID=3127016 RepID=A0A934KAV2_9BACT|nr:bifunctional transaldolase/phosoglucose isomerase [Candidatus Dormibacteraeota bacterium]MBJ7611296.1 bifunctional transaldolase/phosoglucose isomerase [Candidatus Dormibacteraeota bacterium]PZR98814.1 MAG: transaldolase [Candidatus Dormibacteraeota bacterium]